MSALLCAADGWADSKKRLMALSLSQLIDTVKQLGDQGSGFRSLTKSLDTTTPNGMLVFHIFGAMAEFERSITRERTRAGLHAARARGRKGGRPPAVSPKDIIAAKALLTDPNITVDEVARRLGVSPATLYRHLPAAERTSHDLGRELINVSVAKRPTSAACNPTSGPETGRKMQHRADDYVLISALAPAIADFEADVPISLPGSS
jgi:DNA invertase Pin-like site-specific DNA recombinase